MSTNISKPKAASLNGGAIKNGTPAIGISPKSGKPKKSLYEEWIEKYGVSDSKADRLMVKTIKKIQEASSKSES